MNCVYELSKTLLNEYKNNLKNKEKISIKYR